GTRRPAVITWSGSRLASVAGSRAKWTWPRLTSSGPGSCSASSLPARAGSPATEIFLSAEVFKEYNDGSRQAVSQRSEEAPDHPGSGVRLPWSTVPSLPQGEGAGHPLAGLLLP